jgi:hypothetical protein
MNTEERRLILDLSLGRMPERDFLAQFPVNLRDEPGYITREFQNALQGRDAGAVESAMLLGFRIGFPKESAKVLCELLLAE